MLPGSGVGRGKRDLAKFASDICVLPADFDVAHGEATHRKIYLVEEIRGLIKTFRINSIIQSH